MDASPQILTALTGQADATAFIEQHWNGTFRVTHGSRERFLGLVLPRAYDLEYLLGVYLAPVMVYGPEVASVSGGLTDRMLVQPGEARQWYDRKAALEFDFLDTYIPQLSDAAQALAREISLPDGTIGKSIAYASATGAGLAAHFDAYANFVIQVSGSKVWRLAPNTAFTAPVEHYSMSEYPLVPASLRRYQTGDLPTDYRSASVAVELRPGSVLFVPRGWWHATEASGESVSVNLTFSVPTWLDLIVGQLRDSLAVSPQWREHVLPAAMDGDGHQVAAQLLSAASAALRAIAPASLLAQQALPHDTYQLALATFHEALAVNTAGE